MHMHEYLTLAERKNSVSTIYVPKNAGNILQPSSWGRTGAWPSCSVIICPINQKKQTETLALKLYFSGLWGLRQHAES